MIYLVLFDSKSDSKSRALRLKFYNFIKVKNMLNVTFVFVGGQKFIVSINIVIPRFDRGIQKIKKFSAGFRGQAAG
jgi:hypothetical protein